MPTHRFDFVENPTIRRELISLEAMEDRVAAASRVMDLLKQHLVEYVIADTPNLENLISFLNGAERVIDRLGGRRILGKALNGRKERFLAFCRETRDQAQGLIELRGTKLTPTSFGEEMATFADQIKREASTL